MRRRRIATGLESPPENEEPMRRARPMRKVAAGGLQNGDGEDVAGYMGWKVSFHSLKRSFQGVLEQY